MKVSLVAGSTKTDHNTLNFVSSFFRGICQALHFDESNIEEVIFADDQNYGLEIKKIDSTQDYTNTSEYIGFGKTISVGNGKSSIVLNSAFFSVIVNMINDNDFHIYPNRLYLHLVAHEVGHCIDNSRGENDVSVEPIEITNMWTFTKYHFEILLSEFHANRNISSLYDTEAVTTELRTFYLPDLEKQSLRYYAADLSPNAA